MPPETERIYFYPAQETRGVTYAVADIAQWQQMFNNIGHMAQRASGSLVQVFSSLGETTAHEQNTERHKSKNPILSCLQGFSPQDRRTVMELPQGLAAIQQDVRDMRGIHVTDDEIDRARVIRNRWMGVFGDNE